MINISKKFKKPVAFLLALGLVLGSGVATVNAANVLDTAWYHSGFGNADDKGGVEYTGARVKEDASKSYVDFTTWTGGKGDYLELSVVDSSFNKISNHAGLATKTGQYWVTNLAHESGVRNVRLKMDSAYRLVGSWEAGGVWSPDSMPR